MQQHLHLHLYFLLTRQIAFSLSDGNKATIYCAWASNAAFSSAYGSWSSLGVCSPPPSPPPLPPPAYQFTDTASLRAAAQEHNANAADATAIYGPISSWGVSAITSMYQLFYGLGDFNADISSWNTSGVTDMGFMFSSASVFNQPLSLDTSSVTNMEYMLWVRSARAPASSLHTWVLPARCSRRRSFFTPSRYPGPHVAPVPMLPFGLGRGRRCSASR